MSRDFLSMDEKKFSDKTLRFVLAGLLGVALILVIIYICSNTTKKTSGEYLRANGYEHRVDLSMNEKLGITPVPIEPPIPIIDQEHLGDTTLIAEMSGLSANGHMIEIKNGITYVDGFLIANKTYGLPQDYVPTGTVVSLAGLDRSYVGFEKNTSAALKRMQEAAKAEGVDLEVGSGYRSYNYQKGLYDKYVEKDGKEAADRYSARPGYSEHQSALCFDLSPINDTFADTPAGIWVQANCYKYGFIIRYPKEKENITGYKYESWHLRYVGEELSTKLYNDGNWITMEEYFGLFSKYAN